MRMKSRTEMWAKALTVVGVVAASVTLDAGAAQAQAQTFTFNERLRFNDRSFVVPATPPNKYAGKMVILNGGLHVLLHLTRSSSGNCLVKGHVNPQGLRIGLGSETFRAVGAANVTVQSHKEGETRYHLVTNLGLKSGGGPGERLKLNLKGEAPKSCTTIQNLVLESVEVGG